MANPVIQLLLKIAILFLSVLTAAAYLVLVERKFAGYFQERYGPNRVGPFGLLQPMADAIKLLFKEDIVFKGSERSLYILAPAISAISALLPLAVIPYSASLRIADINVGLLYILAVASFGTYGILLGGWSSNSKYALMGALRAAAQTVSYEIPMAIVLVAIVIQSQSLSLTDIVNSQAKLWYVVPQFIGFVTFFIAALAETNRLPFDLPEAESELVAGFHTEYSGFKFALFFVGEYIHLLVVGLLTSVLFLGGWYGPMKSGIHWLLIKTFVVVYIFIWFRWTFPRFRFDQLMRIGWKLLIPASLLNLLITTLLNIS